MQMAITTELQIALTVIVPISIFGLNTWVSIKTKFAASEAEAIYGIKRSLFTVFKFISVLYLILTIVWWVSSPEPLSKLSIMGVLLTLFSLSWLFTLWLFGKYLEVLRDSSEIQRRHIAITESIIAHVKDAKNV
jgi:hypothetical protein